MAISEANRKKFEKMGASLIRIDLPVGCFICDEEDRSQALEWIAEHEKSARHRESIRYWLMFLFTFIAALAGCIAAWPVLTDWLKAV